MKREKAKVIIGTTAKEAEEAVKVFAEADARINEINAAIDLETIQIQEKYNQELTELKATKKTAFIILQTYATENKHKLFKDRKSVITPHGLFGFRTGKHQLKPLKGFTWEKITQLLKEKLPAYVREKIEPAKDKLLADRNVEEVAQHFETIGIKVHQDESFFVERNASEDVPVNN